MLRRLLSLALLASALCVGSAPRAFGYTFTASRWTAASATLHLQLGPATAPLADGFASWGASAEDAITLWNQQLRSFRFDVARDSTAAKTGGNRVNNVYFAADIYGQAWGSGVLAVTYTYSTRATTTTETDVLFNNRLNWDSYRGALRRNAAGQSVYDFHRVALHEFGHALGLDHPDEAGQSVSALMNSHVGSVDTLTSDDITGGQSLYGAASLPPPPSPPVAAPVITTQPTSRTITAGQNTTFSVVASSTAVLTYQWSKSGAALPGATTSSHTIASAVTADAGPYTVTVSNSAGSVTSTAATLTVNAPVAPTPPAPAPTTPTAPSAPTPPPPPPSPPAATAPQILAAPASQAVAPGQPVTFRVIAGGTAPFSYQWRKDGTALPGATAVTHEIASAQPAHVASYSVTVANSVGSVTSPSATLTLAAMPAISGHPLDHTVAAGTPLTLTVVATGAPAPTFQWRFNGNTLPAATNSTYAIAAARVTDAGTYTVTASNLHGTVTSNPATIVVHAPPAIVTAPVAQSVDAGARVQFSVVASGSPALTYQWFHDGIALGGATASLFLLDAVPPTAAGNYTVRVANPHGATLSPPAQLMVRHSRLVNLSTRGFVPPGGSLTPGFYLRGAKPKSLLVRAVGPTLATFGVDTALSETSLEVIAQSSTAIVAANNDWGGTASLRNVFASVGAFPFAVDSKDAAVQADLAPSGYSVRIGGGTAAASGVTLAEIYDADPAWSPTQLVNLSTLGFVGSGENALTAGFVISGNTPKRVLLRAIGPGLAQFGVANLLLDPQLGLVPFGHGEPLAANDNWPDTAELRAAFTRVAAFPLTSGSHDAALIATLPPGAYTAVVSSTTGTITGTALVEIYDLDP